jgi:hypothetical protein
LDQNHPQTYRRDGLRYASDTTAKEWIVLRPLLPNQTAGCAYVPWCETGDTAAPEGDA